MKPYYEHAGITIYHGDCREVMEEWEGLRTKSFDLLLTDPPYGLGDISGSKHTGGGWVTRPTEQWDNETVDWETIATAIRMASVAIIWGGNYYPVPPSQGWLVWDKCRRDFSLADCELAWTNRDRASRVFSYNRSRQMADDERFHPTQKPTELMLWCIGIAGESSSVLDPFMGSGTTLTAAKQLGKMAVGIEIQEKYCEVAAKRLSQEALPLW